jgi:EAL domain-containing protein (putative c-di-GMP-specific phosphodiesterase class I)
MANGISTVHSGSSFNSFLEEEGFRDEVEATALKRVLAWQFEQAMAKQQKTKQSMAKELKTSRSQLDRLLDPQNTAVSLETLTRAANVLGKRLVLEIRDKRPAKAAAVRVAHRAAKTVSKKAMGVGAGSGLKFHKTPLRAAAGFSGR